MGPVDHPCRPTARLLLAEFYLLPSLQSRCEKAAKKVRRGGPREHLGSDSWVRQVPEHRIAGSFWSWRQGRLASSLPCPPHPTPFSTRSSAGQDPSEPEVRTSLQASGGLRSGENSGLGLLSTRPVFCVPLSEFPLGEGVLFVTVSLPPPAPAQRSRSANHGPFTSPRLLTSFPLSSLKSQ